MGLETILGGSKRRNGLLDEVGFEWDTQEARWQEMFERLQKYHSQFGNANEPDLVSWVANQRVIFKQLSIAKGRVVCMVLYQLITTFTL
jgi:Helicase associated domain